MRPMRGIQRPRDGFFLRAESRNGDRASRQRARRCADHRCLQWRITARATARRVVPRAPRCIVCTENGFYILDEPEILGMTAGSDNVASIIRTLDATNREHRGARPNRHTLRTRNV